MNTAIAQTLLAWLLTYALHSTVLLVVTWVVLRNRRVTPAIADVAWKTALVGGIITATLQGVAARRPAGTLFLGASSASQVASNSPVGAQQTVDPTAAAAQAQKSETSTKLDAATGVASQPETALDGAVADVSNSAASTPSIATVLSLTWLVVALALVAWYVGRRLVLVGRLGDRRPVVDGPTLAILEETRRDTRARSLVRLTASATISSPVALGGEICLPSAAIVELEPAQLRAMLAHELAHLERRDPQWLAFACILERAFFFQPFNRLARRGLQENAEFLADEWAARHSGGVPLAKALVKVAEWMQASPLGVPVAGFAEERSQLTVRVTRLLDGVGFSTRSRWSAVAFATLAIMVTAAFAPGVSGAAAPGNVEPYQLPSSAAPSGAPSGAPTEPVDLRSGVTGRGALSAAPVASGPDFPLVSNGDGSPLADTAIVRAVMARLRDESKEVRRAAADALGRMKHPMSIDALVVALDDLDGEVRRASLQALSNFDHDRVPAPPIRRMLENADYEMRSHAVRMLGEMRDRASIAAITALLGDAKDEVRYSALHALEELEAPVADDVLTRSLGDPSADVRQAAASLAGERQVVGVVPALIHLLDDRNSDVRESAANALTEMRTPESHAALRKALTHRDPSVRRIAVEYFGEEVDK